MAKYDKLVNVSKLILRHCKLQVYLHRIKACRYIICCEKN